MRIKKEGREGERGRGKAEGRREGEKVLVERM